MRVLEGFELSRNLTFQDMLGDLDLLYKKVLNSIEAIKIAGLNYQWLNVVFQSDISKR